jgi:hypothetical protein
MAGIGFAFMAVGLSAVACAGMAGAGGGERLNLAAGALALLLACQTLYYALDAVYLAIDLKPRPLPPNPPSPAGA